MPARRHRPREEEDTDTSPAASRNVRFDRRTTYERYSDAASLSPPTANGSKRTGVACDRCRERKIKCDASAGRCKPCKEHDVPCEVTDRNTGERHRRNQLEEYMIALSNKEEQLHRLIEDNERLRQQIETLGEQPVSQEASVAEAARAVEQHGTIEAFNPARVGENYLGAAGHPNLSMLQGSQMTIFGNAFDLDRFFVRSDQNHVFELSQKEYKDHALGTMAALMPTFPPQTDTEANAGLFFYGIAFFTPVVHRPAFYELIDRIYNQTASLSMEETVIFHMVMSLAEFQKAVRDRKNSTHLGTLAKGRLLWCLTNVFKLMNEDSLQSMQALVLMCLAMRSLQRPGPAWSFCDHVLTKAMELGYHRSLSAWKSNGQRHNRYPEEMRQRIFWTLMVVHVNISGNLGLPMRLRYEDIDIEIPTCTPDSIHDEDAGVCTWSAAPHGFQLTQIMLQVYSTVCTIRPSLGDRGSNAFQLNKQLADLELALPQDYLTLAEQTSPNAMRTYIAGLYLKLGIYATRLIILHPRHLRSHPFENSAHHLDTLMKTSRGILVVAEELCKFQSLDTTVYYTMDFIYAIFVALFVTSQQQTQVVGLESIKKDMQRWRSVLQDVGEVLGTGLALRDAIVVITTKVLDKIRDDIEKGVLARESASMSPTVSMPIRNDALDITLQYNIPQPFYPPPCHGSGPPQPHAPPAYGMPHSIQPAADAAHPLQHVPQPHGVLGYPGTIPADAVLQPYEGAYHGAQAWQNTMTLADTAAFDARSLPVSHDSSIAGTPQSDIPPWSQYYVSHQ